MSELSYFALLVTGYFAAINTVYLVQLVIGWRAVRRRLRSLVLEDFHDIRESGIAPPVSIVVPAYNEGKTIIESVRSLLALRYPRLEVVVVNDGSRDDTLDLLIAAFGLRRTPRVYWQRIKSKPVRGIYWSSAYPGLWVLDKVNGRKADAVNAGLSGPMLRASGVAYDVRKDFPYLDYETYDFDVPVGTNGDVYDRFLCRMEELRQSVRILEQAAARLPEGPINVDDARVILPPKSKATSEMESMIHHFKQVMEGPRPPVGETYVAVESPKGEKGYYFVSDGTPKESATYNERCAQIAREMLFLVSRAAG